jgi:hypothetical protein
LPRKPSAFAAHSLGHVQQELCVSSCVTDRADRGIIASVFSGGRQLPFQPPGQRMKPEDAAVDVGKKTNQRITTFDMRVFV